MDWMEIVVSVVLIVILTVFSGKKKKNRADSQHTSAEMDEHFPVITADDDTKIPQTTLLSEEGMRSRYEKKDEYFTYESDNLSDNEKNWEKFRQEDKIGIDNLQNADNENAIGQNMKLDREELIKGIIYSEILQSPYK